MTELETETTKPTNGRWLKQLMKPIALWLTVAIVAAAIWSSLLFVGESEWVIVERLGEIVAVYDQPESTGLHWKLPWPLDISRRFDRRLQLFDPAGREYFTRDKKNITIDLFLCWKVDAGKTSESSDFQNRPVVRFFKTMGQNEIAESRLEGRLRSIVSTEMGRVDFSELFHVESSEQGPEQAEASMLAQLSAAIQSELQKRSADEPSLSEAWGVNVVDVRIKRPNLPEGNLPAVFDRMKSERRKIADQYRSAGLADNRLIKSQADRQHAEILARADRESQEIRGRGEAEAIQLLNAAHELDPEFYQQLQSLETYQQILNDRTTFVLSTSSQILKLLTEGIPAPSASKPTSDSEPETKPENEPENE